VLHIHPLADLGMKRGVTEEIAVVAGVAAHLTLRQAEDLNEDHLVHDLRADRLAQEVNGKAKIKSTRHKGDLTHVLLLLLERRMKIQSIRQRQISKMLVIHQRESKDANLQNTDQLLQQVMEMEDLNPFHHLKRKRSQLRHCR